MVVLSPHPHIYCGSVQVNPEDIFTEESLPLLASLFRQSTREFCSLVPKLEFSYCVEVRRKACRDFAAVVFVFWESKGEAICEDLHDRDQCCVSHRTFPLPPLVRCGDA